MYCNAGATKYDALKRVNLIRCHSNLNNKQIEVPVVVFVDSIEYNMTSTDVDVLRLQLGPAPKVYIKYCINTLRY